MSQSSHLYFDHPQEPDPEEKGLTWATRYIDDRMVFDFKPDDLYSNAVHNVHGFPYTGDVSSLLVEVHYCVLYRKTATFDLLIG